jgi:hypothetical protein
MIINRWDVDLERMSCRNRVNRITVRFTGTGNSLDGEIEDVPMGLLSALARSSDGPAYLGRQLREAERAFVPEFIKGRAREQGTNSR